MARAQHIHGDGDEAWGGWLRVLPHTHPWCPCYFLFTGGSPKPRVLSGRVSSLRASLHHPFKPLRRIPRTQGPSMPESVPSHPPVSPRTSHTLNIACAGSRFLRPLKCDTPAGGLHGRGSQCWGGPSRRWDSELEVPSSLTNGFSEFNCQQWSTFLHHWKRLITWKYKALKKI